MNRRRLLTLAAPAALCPALSAERARAEDDLPEPVRVLQPLTDGVSPITLEEHHARLARAQALLAESGLDALVIGPGSSLLYFSGAQWGLSERFLGLVMTRSGAPAWVVPAFERDRAAEQVRVGSDVRVFEEDEPPYALVAAFLRERGVATGRLGIEETMPFVFSDGIAKAVPALTCASATPVTAGCRMIKDAHELDLMRRACAITLRAHRAVFASLREGTTAREASAWCAAAHRRLGVPGGALVLFGPDAAFPHGTRSPRSLRRGDVVLIDGGGEVHGYASDITRTAVFGAPPTDRQRRLWDLVRQAQDAAFRATRPGVECQALDAAARRVIEEGGLGPGYRHFTHRLGHGIGLDGHEWPYIVRGSTLSLRPGMTFTNEPGVYLPGELGIRHEDTVAVTDEGCENLAPKWSGTPEEPAVV